MAQQQTATTESATYEQELRDYLQKRIKPGLNSGAIPLLVRSIAKEIAQHGVPGEDQPDEEPTGAAEEKPEAEAEAADEAEAEAGDEPDDKGDDEPEGEGDDEPEGEGDDEPAAKGGEAPDFETEMHDLQADLGEDWIVRFSVQGDDEWLTAEKEDGSQRIEAATADVLVEAVGLLNERGRSS